MNCCALSALDGNGGGKPRALPWAVMLRPFRPALCGAILDEESHGFSVDGTAQVLRYGRLGSLRYDVGMPSCQQKNCCALSVLDGNGGGKPRALPWAVMLRPFRPALCGVILDEESHGFSVDGTAQVLRYGRLGPAGLPARLSGAGRTVGNGLRRQKERLTRSVRRVAGRYGPVARAPPCLPSLAN